MLVFIIKKNNQTETKDKLKKAYELRKIRRYETISDKKFDEIFDQYLKKFVPSN